MPLIPTLTLPADAFPRGEVRSELSTLLTWWTDHMVDHTNGGFFGRIDGHGVLHPMADKGVILNSRLLWGFAAAANYDRRGEYVAMADRAYRYLTDHFFDPEYPGVFWAVDAYGRPVNDQKQVYAQAFTIYALAEYYELTKDDAVLKQARPIFQQIEKYSRDREKGGYLNVFERDWTLAADQRLSDKDEDQAKIMNTHLHVMEAYANLYRVAPTPVVGEALRNVIRLIMDKFCDRTPRQLYLFFTVDWVPSSEEKSFGHDVECAWLLREAAIIAEDEALLGRAEVLALELATTTLRHGRDASGLIIEEEPGERHWWPQAEAVVGFLDAYQLSGNPAFLAAAGEAWTGIKKYFRDTRNGEWHWLIDGAGQPLPDREDKAGPWKAPYHNLRMCLEVLKRI